MLWWNHWGIDKHCFSMKFMANVLLYLAESSQKCSAVLLDKICQIAHTGCFVQNGINLLVGPDWEDWLDSDNQSGISLNLRTGPTGHTTLFNHWEGALVFIKTQIKTSPQWSKIFTTVDGVGQILRWVYSTRLGFTFNISKKTFHVRE